MDVDRDKSDQGQPQSQMSGLAGSGLDVLSEAATFVLAKKRVLCPAIPSYPIEETASSSDMSSEVSERANHKRSASPTLIVDEGSNSDRPLSGHSSNSSRMDSPSSHRTDGSYSGFSVAQLVLRRDRSASNTSLTYRGSPYDHQKDAKRSSDLAAAVIQSSYANQMVESDEEEQPLDMSLKSRNSREAHCSRSIFGNSSAVHQQLRPSVIQCGPRSSLASPISNTETRPYSYVKYDDQSRHRSLNKSNSDSISDRASKLRILSTGEDSEPDIDDHFRRSLGNKYPQVLKHNKSPPRVEAVPEVDDHFAKALGPGWLKLKKNGKEAESPSTNKLSAQGVTS